MTTYGISGPPRPDATVCVHCGAKAVYPHKDVDTSGHWKESKVCTVCWRPQ